MNPVDLVHAITALMALVAAVLALVRLGRGPTLLDRAVANDVLTAAGVGVVAVMIVWWSRVDLGVLLVILALTSFMTSVIIARHSVRENAAQRRILSPAEAARQRAEREEAARVAEERELEEAARAAETADDDTTDHRAGTPAEPTAPVLPRPGAGGPALVDEDATTPGEVAP